MDRIIELKELITKYDKAYREGDAMVSDNTYDILLDELKELIGENDLFFKNSIKSNIFSDSNRREHLPTDNGIIMSSMNKIKSVDEFLNYLRLKSIPTNIDFIISGKYDGISMLKNEETKKSYSKGREDQNGITNGSLRCDNHLKLMNDVTIPLKYTFGEVIISKNNFKKMMLDKNTDEQNFSPRNIVSGLFRRDEPDEDLLFCDFIRYGYFDNNKSFKTKKEVFDYLNNFQKIKIPYRIVKISELSDEFLKKLYNEFSQEYILDGLILEVNDLQIQADFGRDSNKNPIYAIAYKSKDFDERKITKVLDILWQISKSGNCIPVAEIEMVVLGGTEVRKVTMNNASYLMNMGANKGSVVEVLKSGSVIPLIDNVIEKTPFVLPNIEGGVEWDMNNIHIKTISETDEQKKKKIFAFFSILGVENVSDKTFNLLFESGFKTIKDILSLTKEDLLKLERFGDRKAEIVYNAINSKTKDIPLNKLMHSSGFFKLLGQKKLALLEHFTEKPSIEDITKISGFSEISAKSFIDAYDIFYEFIKDLPITWKRSIKMEASSNVLEGKCFVYSGFRDKKSEEIILSKNGTIGSSISKKTTYLIISNKNSGSSKELKAKELGVIILDKNELYKLLNIV
jgi:NAD-dependent DNA ligase